MFVNNVLDVTYASSINSNTGNNNRSYNNPRMVGARARMDW